MADFLDEIRDAIGDAIGADFDEGHAWGNGFDREVCRGCEDEGKVLRGAAPGCQMCGCPFASLSRVGGGSPPEGCPRIEEHRRRG